MNLENLIEDYIEGSNYRDWQNKNEEDNKDIENFE